MKKMWVLALLIPLVLTMCVTAKAAEPVCATVTMNGSTSEAKTFTAALTDVATATAESNAVITLTTDVTLDSTWASPEIGSGVFTLDGNGKTITGLTKPLFAAVWSNADVEIKNLTISDVSISGAYSSHTGKETAGGFISFAGYNNVTLTNCKLINSSVSSGELAGGLIGYYGAQGKLIIDSCEVSNCTISNTSDGSTGAIIAHTNGGTEIKNTKVSKNTLSMTSNRPEKMGVIIGTNQGDTKFSVTEVEKSTIIINNGTAVETPNICGRNSGALRITGGSYFTDPQTTVKMDNGTVTSDETIVQSGGEYMFESAVPAPTPTPTPTYTYVAPSGHQFNTTLQGINKVTVGGKVLSGADYTVVGTNVIIAQAYIDELASGSYKVVIENDTHIAVGTLVVKNGAAVESAKTFDAGIAIYAGMALTSALGAAYVCRKK